TGGELALQTLAGRLLARADQAAPAPQPAGEVLDQARRAESVELLGWIGEDAPGGPGAGQPSAEASQVLIEDGLTGADRAVLGRDPQPARPAQRRPLAQHVAAAEADQAVLLRRPEPEGLGVSMGPECLPRQNAPGAVEPQPQHQVDVLPVCEQ